MRCKRGEGGSKGGGGGGGEGGGTLWALNRSDFREVLVRSEASHTLQVACWLKKPLALHLPYPNLNPIASPHLNPNPNPNPNLSAAGGRLAQDAAALRAAQRRAGAAAALCNPVCV